MGIGDLRYSLGTTATAWGANPKVIRLWQRCPVYGYRLGGLLEGSWGVVATVISKVTIPIAKYNPVKVLITY